MSRSAIIIICRRSRYTTSSSKRYVGDYSDHHVHSDHSTNDVVTVVA